MTKYSATILIVEDDTALNDAYSMILTSAKKYEVRRAFDGKEALANIAENGDPDVILLDLRMPVLDGLGFLREYHPTEHPDATIVVFSNYDAHKDIDEAYSLGVERYVLKARAAPKDLLHLIEGIIEEKKDVAA
jgi:CheY-like chemotaxis protein